MPASFSSAAYTPGDIVAGNAHLLIAVPVTIASGENLTRGAVLGKVTASGEYKLSVAAAADGSQTPDAILAEDVDASAGAKAGLAYIRGDFIAEALTYGAGHDADSIRDGLRGKGIFLIHQA
ncbi:MAG TPA: head decoration protein [Thermopetrobacter sp.]|nr:head decoration protein [Thermopetrobacter sp.]